MLARLSPCGVSLLQHAHDIFRPPRNENLVRLRKIMCIARTGAARIVKQDEGGLAIHQPRSRVTPR